MQSRPRERCGQSRKDGREFALAPSLVLDTGGLSPLKLSWHGGSLWHKQEGVKLGHYRYRGGIHTDVSAPTQGLSSLLLNYLPSQHWSIGSEFRGQAKQGDVESNV